MNAPALIWIADHSFIMTEKTTNAPKVICTAVQIKNKRYIAPLTANHNEDVFPFS